MLLEALTESELTAQLAAAAAAGEAALTPATQR